MKKLLLLLTVVLFASCSPDDNNSKKGVEILSYELTKTPRTPSGYYYVFDVLVKNHSNESKSGIINVSLDMGNNIQGFHHINVTLEPNETKVISDYELWYSNQNGVITHIRFDEFD